MYIVSLENTFACEKRMQAYFEALPFMYSVLSNQSSLGHNVLVVIICIAYHCMLVCMTRTRRSNIALEILSFISNLVLLCAHCFMINCILMRNQCKHSEWVYDQYIKWISCSVLPVVTYISLLVLGGFFVFQSVIITVSVDFSVQLQFLISSQL